MNPAINMQEKKTSIVWNVCQKYDTLSFNPSLWWRNVTAFRLLAYPPGVEMFLTIEHQAVEQFSIAFGVHLLIPV
jgi:hypothetical protein